jgi:hypothetical protein
VHDKAIPTKCVTNTGTGTLPGPVAGCKVHYSSRIRPALGLINHEVNLEIPELKTPR